MTNIPENGCNRNQSPEDAAGTPPKSILPNDQCGVMSTVVVVTTDLAIRINEAHELATRHAGMAIEYARQAGELLIEAKATVEHGGWLQWLESNCAVGERQAQRYMRLYSKLESIEAKTTRVSELSLRGAMGLITEPVPLLREDDDDRCRLDGERYPFFVPGHSAFCYVRVNNFPIFVVSESREHAGYWHLADMVDETYNSRPAKPIGIRAALSQDLRITGDPFICRWDLRPVEYLFNGASS